MKIKRLNYKCLLALVFLFFVESWTCSAAVLQVNQKYWDHKGWCWAACSQAILEYYRTVKTQTEIAQYGTNGEIRVNNLYGSDSYPTCRGIDLILTHFGNLATVPVPGPLLQLPPLMEVQTEIGALRPFVVRWALNGSGGHFVVAHGIVGDLMILMDPENGPTINTYDWVCQSDLHTWTSTLKIAAYPTVTCHYTGQPLPSGQNVTADVTIDNMVNDGQPNIINISMNYGSDTYSFSYVYGISPNTYCVVFQEMIFTEGQISNWLLDLCGLQIYKGVDRGSAEQLGSGYFPLRGYNGDCVWNTVQGIFDHVTEQNSVVGTWTYGTPPPPRGVSLSKSIAALNVLLSD